MPKLIIQKKISFFFLHFLCHVVWGVLYICGLCKCDLHIVSKWLNTKV